MPGPARAGLFIYAVEPERLARFYQGVAGMRCRHVEAELRVLESDDIQLLLHRIPPAVAARIHISVPPQRREDTALKFFLSVPDLSAAAGVIRELGGELFAERWQGPGFIMANAMDPEGNVLQLRQFDADPASTAECS